VEVLMQSRSRIPPEPIGPGQVRPVAVVARSEAELAALALLCLVLAWPPEEPEAPGPASR